MTDNEIIKAYEQLIDLLVKKKKVCIYEQGLLEDIFDLLNRQKSEIERYLHSIKLLENDVATAKSEAIKEFAERLKDSADKTRIRNLEREKIIFYTDELKLDKLVKEMTEVNENDGA